MLIVFFIQSRGAPTALMFLSLLLALYLTVVELRQLDVHWKWWAWWLSFVFLTHFFGYLVLRGYVVYRRWHHRPEL